MKPTMKGKGGQYEQEIVALRHHLHRHPELSGEEHETSKKVQEELEEHGIPFTSGYATTGVLGVIEGAKPGRTVALRADMDALPIEERRTNTTSSPR